MHGCEAWIFVAGLGSFQVTLDERAGELSWSYAQGLSFRVDLRFLFWIELD